MQLDFKIQYLYNNKICKSIVFNTNSVDVIFNWLLSNFLRVQYFQNKLKKSAILLFSNFHVVNATCCSVSGLREKLVFDSFAKWYFKYSLVKPADSSDGNYSSKSK